MYQHVHKKPKTDRVFRRLQKKIKFSNFIVYIWLLYLIENEKTTANIPRLISILKKNQTPRRLFFLQVTSYTEGYGLDGMVDYMRQRTLVDSR